MKKNTGLVLGLLAGGLAAFFLYPKIARRAKYWQLETEKARLGGYLPPKPGFIHASIMRAFCIAFGFVEVGPIKIAGKDRLPRKGPAIIAPLHVDAGDASVVSALLGIKPMHYLIRTTEMVGWRAYLATMTGAIAVDEESQEGRSRSFKAAIEALANGGPEACLLIFPQGELIPDERVQRHDFKSGTMAIARIAARKRKEAIWIVPLAIHYKTHPKQGTAFQRFVEKLGFSKFRNLFGHKNYGAYAVVGRPFAIGPKKHDLDSIPLSQRLDDDAEKATDQYVERMRILQKAAVRGDRRLLSKEGRA